MEKSGNAKLLSIILFFLKQIWVSDKWNWEKIDEFEAYVGVKNNLAGVGCGKKTAFGLVYFGFHCCLYLNGLVGKAHLGIWQWLGHGA